MQSLNDSVKEYTAQLRKGDIQKAYRGIIAFMSALKKQMESKYPELKAGNLYFGYMDMTYFAFTPAALIEKFRLNLLKSSVTQISAAIDCHKPPRE